MKFVKSILLAGFVITIVAGGAYAQTTGTISGTVVDSLGAVVVGATVTAVPAGGGKEKFVVTNSRGEYNIGGLAPGKYTVKTIAPKFALYENSDIVISAGAKNELIVTLTVGGVQENVNVSNDSTVSTDPENNMNMTVIKGADLEALPDDPDELQAALQAIAGAAAGPDGAQINIDGFSGGRMPTKEAIREIRINQ